MAEPDYVACLNHVVDVHNLILEAEGPRRWGKGIVVIADLVFLTQIKKSVGENVALFVSTYRRI
jgi:hypothetical protein